MTAKRFTMVCMSEDLVELNDNRIYKVFNDIGLEKLLNELHEENEDLAIKKEDVEYELIHLIENYKELLEKNKKQFMGIGQLIDKYEELLEEINSLRKENMKLKELEG